MYVLFVSKSHKGTFFEGEGDEYWLLTGPPAPWAAGASRGAGMGRVLSSAHRARTKQWLAR